MKYNLGQGQNQKCRTSNTRTPSQDFPPVDYASAAAIGIAVAMATLMGSGQMSSQAPGQMPGSLERHALCWELGARNLKFCHRGLRILLIIIQTPIIFPKTLVQSITKASTATTAALNTQTRLNLLVCESCSELRPCA